MSTALVLARFGIPLAIVLRYDRRNLANAEPDPLIPGLPATRATVTTSVEDG